VLRLRGLNRVDWKPDRFVLHLHQIDSYPPDGRSGPPIHITLPTAAVMHTTPEPFARLPLPSSSSIMIAAF
jgi:hypothetical protein